MRKKGFTLIELLAVIVVLAIIALIATPMVLNTIEKARKGAAEASANTYLKAIETYIVRAELDSSKPKLQAGVEYQLSSTNYEVASLADPETTFINDLVEVKGDKPDFTKYQKIRIEKNNLQIDSIKFGKAGVQFETETKTNTHTQETKRDEIKQTIREQFNQQKK